MNSDELSDIIDRVAKRLIDTKNRKSEGRDEPPVYFVDSDNVLEELICKWPTTIVLFTSPMCPACHMYRPIFYEYAASAKKKYGARIGFLEVDVSRAYRLAVELGVMSTPTTVVFYNCKPVDGFVGVLYEDMLEELVSRYASTTRQ